MLGVGLNAVAATVGQACRTVRTVLTLPEMSSQVWTSDPSGVRIDSRRPLFRA